VKTIFFNTGWMRFYKGLTEEDNIKGGGSHVDKHGEGGEIYNFQDRGGITYGYVQPARGIINIDRLGAGPNDDHIENVLVIWIAKNPNGNGSRIVGWHRNAIVYREVQAKQFRISGKQTSLPYFVKTDTRNCHLLDVDERVFEVPRKTKGGLGQSNVWYADSESSKPIRKQMLDYVERGKVPKTKNRKRKKKASSGYIDPEKGKKIEESAVSIAANYYEDLGYSVESREGDNIGWDLDVFRGIEELKVEVKGNMNPEISFELTPNEYNNMKSDLVAYRIAVVSNAISDSPILRIFSYTPETNKWMSKDRRILSFTDIIGARVKS